MNRRGDTIIEVLICLAIIGSALTISYGTARRALFQVRDAQEKNEMMNLSKTQLELLKQYISKNPGISQSSFMYASPDPITGKIFCVENRAGNLVIRSVPWAMIADPKATTCAVNSNGVFYPGIIGDYSDISSIDAATVANVNKDYPYRAAIVYHPSRTVTNPLSNVNEFYAFTGIFSSGGYGNSQGFTVVPLMYRQEPK